MSRCRSCGAEVRWAHTTFGKLMPLDAEPDPNGNVELVGKGQQQLAIVHAQPTMDGGLRYMPHHATCPDAEQWRRRNAPTRRRDA